MLEFFYSNKFDENIVFRNKQKKVSKKVLKQLVFNNLTVLNSKHKNVIILQKDILSFAINFFASVLLGKNIYLVDDVRKIHDLNIEFDILCEANLKLLDNEIDFPKINPDEAKIHLLTSGSSGKSKCILKSLSNLIQEAKDVYSILDISSKSLIVSSSTTCAHLFGLTFGFMFPFCNGLEINLDMIEYPDKFDIENSFFVSTPSFLDTVKKNKIVLNNAKFIVSAGSKLKDETFEYLEKSSFVTEIYGSTETGVIAYRKHWEDRLLTPLKNVKIKATEDYALITTPYAYDNEVIINDKIEFSGNKILLKSRTDRLLKIQEKRISAENMEADLADSEFVKEAYCFKYQDKIACLCALTEDGKKLLIQSGINELTKRLKIFLKDNNEIIPQKWKFIDEIPKTVSGKIDRKLVERLFEINLSFPVILERSKEENTVTLKLFFYKNCNFFAGHFPNFPIAPGVVQLYLASFWGEYIFNKPLVDGQLRKIKFSNIINANDILNLKLNLKEEKVNFEYSNNDKIFSSGVFSCENVLVGV